MGDLLSRTHACSFVCVTANTQSMPRLRLRKDPFLRRARRLPGFTGATPQYRVAEHFDLHPTDLSLLLSGKRSPTEKFVARALTEFPTATFRDLFDVVARSGAAT
jgi:hypothetical protein